MSETRPPCPSPLPWETLVSYWAGDLSAEDEDAAERHLIGCASCTAESGRVAAVTEAVRTMPAVSATPALRIVPGERRDAGAAEPRVKPPPRRRLWLGVAGAAGLAAAVALFALLPRGAGGYAARLPAPVRDAVTVEVSPPASAREVRLEPELADGATANGARVRRLDGGWLAGRVEAGPPFAVVLPRLDLTPGRDELELVWTSPDGHEESRGFYRFLVTPPSTR